MSIELETIRGWYYVASMTRAGTVHTRMPDGSLELLLEVGGRKQVTFWALSRSVVISDDDCDLQLVSIFKAFIEPTYKPDSPNPLSGQAVSQALEEYFGTGMSCNGDSVDIAGSLSVGGTLNANNGIHIPAAVPLAAADDAASAAAAMSMAFTDSLMRVAPPFRTETFAGGAMNFESKLTPPYRLYYAPSDKPGSVLVRYLELLAGASFNGWGSYGGYALEINFRPGTIVTLPYCSRSGDIVDDTYSPDGWSVLRSDQSSTYEIADIADVSPITDNPTYRIRERYFDNAAQQWMVRTTVTAFNALGGGGMRKLVVIKNGSVMELWAYLTYFGVQGMLKLAELHVNTQMCHMLSTFIWLRIAIPSGFCTLGKFELLHGVNTDRLTQAFALNSIKPSVTRTVTEEPWVDSSTSVNE